MDKIRKCKKILYLLIFLLLFFLPVNQIIAQEIDKTVTIKAAVGAYKLILMGYTSPKAIVEVTMGDRLSETTIARDDGIFLFYDIWMPENITELCFITTDVDGISSAPICLPAPPAKDTSIFDIYLPPTFTLETNQVTYNSTAPAAGRTTPDSEVDIYLFRKETPGLVPAAYARSAPKVTIISDSKGYFEFSLPSNTRTIYRVFVGSKFGDFISPKSNTLTYWVIRLLTWILVLGGIIFALLLFLAYLKRPRKRKAKLPCIGD